MKRLNEVRMYQVVSLSAKHRAENHVSNFLSKFKDAEIWWDGDLIIVKLDGETTYIPLTNVCFFKSSDESVNSSKPKVSKSK